MMEIKPLPDEMLEFFESSEVSITNKNPPNVDQIYEFNEIFDGPLLENLKQLHIVKPTLVQRHLMPYILNSDNDLFVQATNGCGKTYAYLVPLIKKAIDWSLVKKNKGPCPSIIIVAHSCLMAYQIHQHVKALLSNIEAISCVMLVGGMRTSVEKLYQGCDILICTLGKLDEMIRNESIDLYNLKVLVFDDAEAIYNFKSDEIDFNKTVVKQVFKDRKDVRRIFIGATYIAKSNYTGFLRRNLTTRISIGKPNFPIVCIEQEIEQVYGYISKEEQFKKLLEKILNRKQIIIFADKDNCNRVKNILERFLEESNSNSVIALIGVGNVHCERVFSNATKGLYKFIVTTSKAMQGLNFPFADTIIMFDFPHSHLNYVDSLGRCVHNAHHANSYAFIDSKEEDKELNLHRMFGQLNLESDNANEKSSISSAETYTRFNSTI